MLTAGEQVRSRSGRLLSPFPQVDTSTDRRCKTTLKRLHQWLLSNALEEAAGSDYLLTLLQGLRADRLSDGDVTTLNDVLGLTE